MKRLVVALMAVALCSCGAPSGEIKTYPAKGQVTLRGKPLAGVLVVLHAVEPAMGKERPSPIGRTDDEGRFQLRTYFSNDGAPEGSYRVAVTMARMTTEESSLSTKHAAASPTGEIDPRYRDPATSGLKVEIKPGENAIPALELK